MNHTKIVKDRLSCGIALNHFGINNWALTKEQVLDLLNEFKRYNVIILGGDIIKLKKEDVEYTYDNWSCNKRKKETCEDYCKRSIDTTVHYLSNYPFSKESKLFITLTIDAVYL